MPDAAEPTERESVLRLLAVACLGFALVVLGDLNRNVGAWDTRILICSLGSDGAVSGYEVFVD
jgi:hypothetical protein